MAESSGDKAQTQSTGRALGARLRPVSKEELERQRRKTSWQASEDEVALNPTVEGFRAGGKWGCITGAVGGVAVYALHLVGPRWFRQVSTGGKVWLVTATAMAGFFVCSEQAVVGTDARARAAVRR